MELDDLEPKRAKSHTVGEDLSKHSVAELSALAETLKGEIVRVEEALAGKQSSKSVAEAAFKR
jgi:uncharacterized small protein (DUF1192 family)